MTSYRTALFLDEAYGYIEQGNSVAFLTLMHSVPSDIAEFISLEPAFYSYLTNLVYKIQSGNYRNITAINFKRRFNSARPVYNRITNLSIAFQAQINAAAARNRNAAAERAVEAEIRLRKANAARMARSRQPVNTANAARQAARNARVAEGLAARRAVSNAAARELANFNTARQRWQNNFSQRLAGGRTPRQVITNLARNHLGVTVPMNGPISTRIRALIHPDRARNTNTRALRTVLSVRASSL